MDEQWNVEKGARGGGGYVGVRSKQRRRMCWRREQEDEEKDMWAKGAREGGGCVGGGSKMRRRRICG